MKSERWDQLEKIFHDALALEPEEREIFVTRTCGADHSLFKEVKSLVVAHERRHDFLEKCQMSAGLSVLAMTDDQIGSGKNIAHYILEKRIGRGGMGDVYLAKDQRLGRNVALKLLSPSFTHDASWILRFQREARAASSIAHPNIGHIYEFDQSDGYHYIAMEYIEGITLRERIKRGRLPVEEAVDIAHQVARALAVAHSTGVLHRDIKPDNIMIHRDGYVKVLDFGLAKWTATVTAKNDNDTSGAFDTQPGIILGSPAYMSPEQARGLHVDEKSDLWSLGVVLYETLTGINPFLSDTRTDTLAAILRTEPVALRKLCPNSPVQLEQIVSKLLSKHAGERYANAELLLANLQRVKETLSHGVADNKSEAVDEKRSRSSIRTNPHERRSTKISSLGIKLPHSYLHTLTKLSKVAVALTFGIAILTVALLKYSNYSAGSKAYRISSLAVLPLINRNEDHSTEYLTQGLSDGLIDRLSRLPRFKVIARGSSFKYKIPIEPQAVARDLGVQAILRGEIAKQGNDLQIDLELVDTSQQDLIWKRQYKYAASDLSAAVNDICRDIGVGLDIDSRDLNLLTMQQTRNGDAYDRYLKGRFHWNQLTEDSLYKSIGYFNEALMIDPQYAPAYAGLADSYVTLGANYGSPAEMFPKAIQHAQKALSIDASLAEARYAIAVTHYLNNWDLSSAERELKRALELKANYAAANSLLCSLSLSRGDTKQALVYINRALDLDPLSLLFNAHLSYIYYSQHENNLAIKQLQKMLTQDSNASFVYNDIAKVYAQMGRFSEALTANQRATVLLGQDPDTLSSLGVVYALSGKTGEAKWVAKTLENLSSKKHVQPYLVASIYGALGNKDQAFAWLSKAKEQRSPHMLRFAVDPIFSRLRSDRRYTELLKSIGFT